MGPTDNVADIADLVFSAVENYIDGEQDAIREMGKGADKTWHRASARFDGESSSLLFWTGDGRAFKITIQRSTENDTDPSTEYEGP